MKVLLLENNIINQPTLDQGVQMCVDTGKTINLDLQFQVKQSTKQFTSIPFSNSVNAHGYEVNPQEIFQESAGYSYDVICLVYDWSKISPQPTNPSDNGQAMQIPCQWFETFPTVFRDYFFHELSHYYAFKNNVEDLTHLLMDGTLQAKYPGLYKEWNAKCQYSPLPWYLHLISQYITPMWPYKHFSPTEPTGGGHTCSELKPELLSFLDKARDLAGVPFIINSGFRTLAENQAVGGAPNSAHLSGLAADINCIDNITRNSILKGVYATGIPCFIEIALQHVHLDVDAQYHTLNQVMLETAKE